MTTSGLPCLVMQKRPQDVDGRGWWRLLETSSSLVSSLLSFYLLLVDSLPSALVDGEIRQAGLLDEDGDGAEEVVVAGVTAIILGRHLPIAASALMILPALDLEVDLLRRVGDQASGRERWVALLRDMRWAGVRLTTTVPPLNKEDHSLADRISMMPERAARRHARRHHSRARQPALDLDRQGVGSRPGSAKYILEPKDCGFMVLY